MDTEHSNNEETLQPALKPTKKILKQDHPSNPGNIDPVNSSIGAIDVLKNIYAFIFSR